VIRSVHSVEERLKKIDYPENSNNEATVVPITIGYKLPNYIFTTEDTTNVKIGVWDEEE